MVFRVFGGFSQIFIRFSSNFGATVLLSPFLEGSGACQGVLDGFTRFWRVFISFRMFFEFFWKGSVCDILKGSGWVSEVLRGFSGVSPVFKSSSSYFGAMALSSRFLEGMGLSSRVLRDSVWF